MTDIVERLRAWQSHKVPKEYLTEAADEIERLRTTLIELDKLFDFGADVDVCECFRDISDLRKAFQNARAALEQKP